MSDTPQQAASGEAAIPPISTPLLVTTHPDGSYTEAPAPEVAPGVFELRVQDEHTGPSELATEVLGAVEAAVKTRLEEAARPVARVGELVQVTPAVAAKIAEIAAPLLLAPAAWAKRKNTPDWLFAAAKARHLADPTNPARTGWLENGQMTEAAYDGAIKATEEGQLR